MDCTEESSIYMWDLMRTEGLLQSQRSEAEGIYCHEVLLWEGLLAGLSHEFCLVWGPEHDTHKREKGVISELLSTNNMFISDITAWWSWQRQIFLAWADWRCCFCIAMASTQSLIRPSQTCRPWRWGQGYRSKLQGWDVPPIVAHFHSTQKASMLKKTSIDNIKRLLKFFFIWGGGTFRAHSVMFRGYVCLCVQRSFLARFGGPYVVLEIQWEDKWFNCMQIKCLIPCTVSSTLWAINIKDN